MSESLREIAFDTETTGLDPLNGDRIIEVGAVEMINYVPTGNYLRMLINPGRPVSEATIRITGITDDMLADKPPFEHETVAARLVEFIGDSPIVAHNAAFDRGFLNMELGRCGFDPYPDECWVDTLDLAKKRFPGAPASLDALCKRFEISLESRTLHGALLDAQLLANVYLELRGGRMRSFSFDGLDDAASGVARKPARQRPKPLARRISSDERAAHAAFVAALGDGAIWHNYD